MAVVAILSTLPVMVISLLFELRDKSSLMSKLPLMAIFPLVVVKSPPNEVNPPSATLVIPAFAVMSFP